MHQLMMLLDISDADLAETLGLSRQSVHKRRTGRTKMSLDHVTEVAEAIGVPSALFLARPSEAIRWIIDNYPELIDGTDPDQDGGGKLRRLADVVQW